MSPPSIDWTYIRSTEQQIAALHLECGSLRTKILGLFDFANSLGRDDSLVGSTASQMTQVVAQISSIEADENRNGESLQKLEHDLQEHWAQYAAFQSRAFCDYMRERLPKELRMMVFEGLWEDAYHTITDWNIKVLNTTPDDPIALVESWSGRDTRHCFEARSVSEELQREILEAWWRMSVFELKSFGLIPILLREGFWGGPVKDKVRSVVVFMGYRETAAGFGHSQTMLRPQLKTAVMNADLDSELGYLSNLSNDTAIRLSIKKRDKRVLRFTTEEKQDGFLEAASFMFSGLEKLRRDGYNIAIVIDKDIEINMGDMDLAKGEWRKMISKATDMLAAYSEAYYPSTHVAS
ncbi:hypothetical protein N0V90_004109 [Kalmusia sp. IMI 367209]|nr:hypothetical protein N0V90_004109 [Kalmusia sp. IMI 367209]